MFLILRSSAILDFYGSHSQRCGTSGTPKRICVQKCDWNISIRFRDIATNGFQMVASRHLDFCRKLPYIFLVGQFLTCTFCEITDKQA